MPRLDLEAYLADDAVRVPVKTDRYPDGDHEYVIPSPNYKDGLLLSAMANLAVRGHLGGEVTEAELEDLASQAGDEDLDFNRKVLGTAYDELVADGVSWVRLERLARYLFVYFAMSEEAAEAMASGEAARPNRETRRAAKKTTSKSTRSASRGSSTRRPAKAAATRTA